MVSAFAGGGWGNLVRKAIVLSPATVAEQLYSSAEKDGANTTCLSFDSHRYYLVSAKQAGKG